MSYNTIDIVFSDLVGRMRRLTVNAHNIEEIEKNGIGIDGSSITGFSHGEMSDLILVPDAQDINIRGRKIQFGDVKNCDGSIFPLDPRTTLKRAREYLKKSGVGDEIFFLPEIEFFIMDGVEIDNSGVNKRVQLISKQKMVEESFYHASGAKDPYFNFREEVVDELEKGGISFKYHHHEVGSFGQAEIELRFMEALVAADVIFLTKEVIKEIAREHNLVVSFMPKISWNHPGNGMHLHQFIIKDGENIFYDGQRELGLSESARWYIGGLLLHSRALCGLTNPSSNSYRRLCGKYETPHKADYSIGDRAKTVRIPAYTRNRPSIRIEYRPPDATGNIYLTLAALMMAGMDGIENRIDPDQVMEKNIRLPGSVEEALHFLEEDMEFLLKGGVFYKDLIKRWIEIKRGEKNKIDRDIPVAEFELYFDV